MSKGPDLTAKHLRMAIAVVEELWRVNPRMELNQALMFLLVAARPGVKQKELGDRLNLGRSATSRGVRALAAQSYPRWGSDEAKNTKVEGLDLVSILDDPFDARGKLVAPTRRGRAVVEGFSRALDSMNDGERDGST